MPIRTGSTLYGWKCCKCGAGNHNGVGLPCVQCKHPQPCETNTCTHVLDWKEAKRLGIE